jgi:N-formylmaleamate deformylase
MKINQGGKRMLKYTEGDLPVDGFKIHYYRTGGKKPPFILLHGATDNGLCWSPVAEWLAAKYDVIMPDAPGHGKSDRLGPEGRVSDAADKMAGLVHQLKLDKPIIMGHSMGAGTTVSIAVKYPELPKAIILEDPAWMEPVDPSKENPDMQKQRAEMLRIMSSYRQMSKEEIMVYGHKTNPKWSEAELLPWVVAKTQFDQALFKSMPPSGDSYKDLAPLINCPTLLLIAETGIVKPQIAQNAAKLWKSTYPFKWVQIMGAGHNIRREQFDKFKEVAGSFLETLK